MPKENERGTAECKLGEPFLSVNTLKLSVKEWAEKGPDVPLVSF